jgi:hypothetical protein
MEFASVVCPTVEIANHVLFTARSKAIGVRAQIGSTAKEHEPAHSFARILLAPYDCGYTSSVSPGAL